MGGNPLSKLERKADKTSASMAKALRRGQESIRQLIRDAGKDLAPGTSKRHREQAMKAIAAHYAAIAQGIDASLRKLAGEAARAATEDVRSHGLAVKFSQERLEAIWDYISPSNERSLAAVFTDKMSDTAIAALRKAHLDVYRQAQIEGWTANETHKRMQEAWNAVADDDGNFRFVDRAGREWENARYLQMLHRTTMARVERDYTVDRMAAAGVTLFQVSDDGSAECDGCKAWEGQILQMRPSKEHPNLPTYDEAVAAGCFHPNCVHYLVPIDPDWGDDAAEIARQDAAPRLPEDASEEDVQARKDAIDLSRYQANGMTKAEAELAMTRERLADAIRIGSFDREASLAVANGLSDAEVREIMEYGIPKFEAVKDGKSPNWHGGASGGVVHFDREDPEASIRDILHGGLEGESNISSPNNPNSEEGIRLAEKYHSSIEHITDAVDEKKLAEELAKIDRMIRGKKREHMVVLNPDGTPRFDEFVSTPTGGRIPREWDGKLEGATLIHNHPELGDGLSPQDILTARGQGLHTIKATSDLGEFSLTAEKWPSRKELEEAMQEAEKEAVEAMNNSNMSYYEKTIHIHDEVAKRLADKLGLVYDSTYR